jgi:hypothetical protein
MTLSFEWNGTQKVWRVEVKHPKIQCITDDVRLGFSSYHLHNETIFITRKE